MPIPQFTQHGVLPPGVHRCTLEEAASRFGGDATRTRRQDLWTKLTKYLELVRNAKIFIAIYIDGSFVTDKGSPRDIDVVLELLPASSKALSTLAQTRPILGEVLNANQVKQAFEIHVFTYCEGTPPKQSLIEYFQSMRVEELRARKLPPGSRRGILRVPL